MYERFNFNVGCYVTMLLTNRDTVLSKKIQRSLSMNEEKTLNCIYLKIPKSVFI